VKRALPAALGAFVRSPLLLLLLASLACAGPRLATQPATIAAAGPEISDPGLLLRPVRAGEPWGHLGKALQARRLLDGEGEVTSLLAAVEAQPAGPAALVALRRLTELVDESPARSAQVDAGVAKLLDSGHLAGLAAYRARVARALAAEALGDPAAAGRFRGQNGVVTAWTLAGPFSALRVLDFERPIPPEQGTLPATTPAPAGLPATPTRAVPVPDGTFALDGEPAGGDVFALVSDVALTRGGRYLLLVNSPATLRVLLDGAQVHERRAYLGWSSSSSAVPVEVGPGRHRLTVKLARTDGRGGITVSLVRADGAVSDASWTAPAPGSSPPRPATPPVVGEPVGTAPALARALIDGAGPIAGRLLAARDAMDMDREAAKALLTEALALAPTSASVQVTLGWAHSGDPTLDPRVAQTRAEEAFRAALAADPDNAEARVLLSRLLVAAERYDAAEEVLSRLVAPAAERPAALAARARTAMARGLPERAEALAAQASAGGGSCEAAQLSRSLAERRQALARVDEAAKVQARCRGGLELLARHLRERGDLAGAAAALDAFLAARPWDVDLTLTRADVEVAQGQPGAAVRRVEALTTLWPRNARLFQALANDLELAGERTRARAARERALALDGGDLTLRRALALDDGREALDDLAFDPRESIRSYEAAGKRNGSSAVMVLDAAAVDIHPGGVATERTQQVIHVLDQAGVDDHGEVSLPAGAEIITLRTLKPDGRSLEPDRASDEKGAVSLTGLEPGDYVWIDYIRSVRAPFAALGYAADPFYFQVARERLFRSTYVVRAPAGAGLAADAHGMPAPEVIHQGGADVVRGERRDVAPFVPEPDAPGTGETLPWLGVGTGASRDAFQRNIADRLVGRGLATEELRAFAARIRAGAKDRSPVGLVRAAYAQVARSILGEGPLLEEASEALSRGRGSRLIVLKAVLEALGFEVRVALVRPFSADPAPHRFPTAAVYPMQVLRVRAGGAVLWLDPSLRMNPFGQLPGWLGGCEALILPVPGEAPAEDRTPDPSPDQARKEADLRIALAVDGGAELSATDRYFGTLGAMLKAQLEPMDATQRRQAVEGSLGRSFRGISVSDVTFEGEDDPEAPLTIRWKGRTPQLALPVNGGLVIETSPLPAQLGPRYVRLASRSTPLLIQLGEHGTTTVTITPPPGLQVNPNPPALLETPFGRYARTDTRSPAGDLLRVERLDVGRARIAPERYGDFARFAVKVDAFQEEPIRLTR
jgi:tetratricopeptide (TPR) repeat protein